MGLHWLLKHLKACFLWQLKDILAYVFSGKLAVVVRLLQYREKCYYCLLCMKDCTSVILFAIMKLLSRWMLQKVWKASFKTISWEYWCKQWTYLLVYCFLKWLKLGRCPSAMLHDVYEQKLPMLDPPIPSVLIPPIYTDSFPMCLFVYSLSHEDVLSLSSQLLVRFIRIAHLRVLWNPPSPCHGYTGCFPELSVSFVKTKFLIAW